MRALTGFRAARYAVAEGVAEEVLDLGGGRAFFRALRGGFGFGDGDVLEPSTHVRDRRRFEAELAQAHADEQDRREGVARHGAAHQYRPIVRRARVDDPADQAQLPHPRLGYCGAVDERVDLAMIERLATQQPAWHFVMLGAENVAATNGMVGYDHVTDEHIVRWNPEWIVAGADRGQVAAVRERLLTNPAIAATEAAQRGQIVVLENNVFLPLSPVRQAGGKLVHAWAVEADLDADAIVSNPFQMEWPPRSGRQQWFPEVDRAAWFGIDEARRRILASQVALIDELTRRC